LKTNKTSTKGAKKKLKIKRRRIEVEISTIKRLHYNFWWRREKRKKKSIDNKLDH
jgi:hypothetical protein